jgi:hypothetical protein
MSDAEKFAKIEQSLQGIQQVAGAETILMSALIVVLNQEIPNFKLWNTRRCCPRFLKRFAPRDSSKNSGSIELPFLAGYCDEPATQTPICVLGGRSLEPMVFEIRNHGRTP